MHNKNVQFTIFLLKRQPTNVCQLKETEVRSSIAGNVLSIEETWRIALRSRDKASQRIENILRKPR
ncbi:hypothetical protein V1477_019984 [Vespula maculifrons]|uniref:Uncharacterized protein n=1 Tax=Vespula maculifrons TaxID=7453 RepID=A0ABD2AKN2_VESMC